MLPAIYFNALYQPDLDRTITPLCSLKVIKLWSGYHLRDDPTFFLKPSILVYFKGTHPGLKTDRQ